MSRASLVSGVVFQNAVGSNYRFWAAVPELHVVLFLAAPTSRRSASEKVLAAVERPEFPPGVCTGCGCSEFDACMDEGGVGCAWIDRGQTRCSVCGPVPR